MKKIGVYGSLRANRGNHRVIQGSNLLSTEVVNIPFKMVSLGAFPGLIPSSENHNITIEVYEVNDSTYKDVERLESYPSFYQKAVIQTSQGEAEVYILEHQRYQHATPVEDGDWNNFLN